MVRAIHTSVKGRARYNIKGLYRTESLKKYLELQLKEKKEIISFSANILTGNIVVFFDPNCDTQTIASLIEDIVIKYRENLRINRRTIINQKKQKGQFPEQSLDYSKSRNSNPGFKEKLRRFIIGAEEQKSEPWHLMETDAVLNFFGVNKNYGLSNKSAQERLKKYGPNVLPESVPRSGLSIFIDQFKSLPVVLLGASAVVSVLTGGIADAVVIIGVVAINALIGYATESQTEKTIHSLKKLIRPFASVIREGVLKEIEAEGVVPGDILIFRPGNFVPADARILEANNLSVDESALTGESMPVLKSTDSLKLESDNNYDIPLADRSNMVYMGTLITGGQGIAIVVATGKFTEIGKIQTLVEEASSPETPMERQLKEMGRQLVLISSGVCGVVFIIGLLRGYGLLQMLKTAISLAVAAVPEGLPTVATTTLALGIRRMRKHNVLIKHLEAVETLGSVQTICLDKTGTITLNKMSIVEVYTGMRCFKFYEGKFVESDNGRITRSILSHKRKCTNPHLWDELHALICISVLCNESMVTKDKNEYIVNGSPTENALVHAAISFGVNVLTLRKRFPLLKVLHRSENRNYMVTIHNIKIRGSKTNQGNIIAIKGSPNEVLSMCGFHIKDGEKIILTEDDRLKIEAENERMAGDALRVLGVAYLYIDDNVEKAEHDKIRDCSENLINSDSPDFFSSNRFVWLGLIGMADPIRHGVKDVIGSFHKAGIDTIIITGDQSPTAYAIGKELNLSRGERLEILDSTHLAKMEPAVLKALVKRVHVFARVSPAHKLLIVKALQSSGRVVAMTGDGINDGPALKAADIGIAMGHTGTDVAREVADVVLEDDNLETMIIAISQGRTIYNNIKKSVHFLLSTNISEIVVMFTGILGGLGQPLNAMQLLWINLISDIAPGLALALEPPEPDILTRPPRKPDEPIIKPSDLKRIFFESSVLSAGSLGAYLYGIGRYGMGQRAGTLAFMSLTIGQILHAISCRSDHYSILDGHELPANRYLDVAVVGSLLLQLLTIVIPGLRNLLQITPISLTDAVIVGSSAIVPLVVNESTKGKMQNRV